MLCCAVCLASPAFDVSEVIADQGVPMIKSGQLPRVYSRNHAAAFLKRRFTLRKGNKKTLPEWCQETFVPSLLKERTHGKTGEKYSIVPAVLPSLKGLLAGLVSGFSGACFCLLKSLFFFFVSRIWPDDVPTLRRTGASCFSASQCV